MVYVKKPKKYSTNYAAVYYRARRKKLAEKDPIALRKTVWVIQAGDKQVVFRDRKDITIKRIPKEDIQNNSIKAY